jgi:hypothetical protein
MMRFAAMCWLAGMFPLVATGSTPTFDEIYSGVSECRFDLSAYSDLPMDPYSDAVLIALPAAGAMRGFLITKFYFSPGREGKSEGYGLVFNAPLDAVAQAFPELAGRETINGHLRRLLRLSDETNDRKASRETLLLCNAGTAT